MKMQILKISLEHFFDIFNIVARNIDCGYRFVRLYVLFFTCELSKTLNKHSEINIVKIMQTCPCNYRRTTVPWGTHWEYNVPQYPTHRRYQGF